ncbi:MAG TPA: TetR family transcriptional regulator [Candidatus Binataceae bacterium]|jgi:TetR/AcrR family transcriptional regulator
MAPIRDLARTREKILAAALGEFSAKGFAGARTQAIARRARVNKRMLYYCFGAKQDLYRAVMRAKIAAKAGAIESSPEDFAEALLHWYEVGCNDLDWIRMLEWEALGSGRARMIAYRERRQLLLKAVARLRRSQVRGRIPADVDLSQLFISMIALTTFPIAFPQMTRLVSGVGPNHPRFLRKRLRFLRWLGERICAPAGVAKPAAAPRARRARVAIPACRSARPGLGQVIRA